MELIADGLLVATAMTAGLYCLVLSRRLRRLTDAGDGIGPRIEALDKALAQAGEALAETKAGVEQLRHSAKNATTDLSREIARGEELATRITRGVEAGTAALHRLYEAEALVNAASGDSASADAHRNGPRVELPEGHPGQPEDAAREPKEPSGAAETADVPAPLRAVLRADRVML